MTAIEATALLTLQQCLNQPYHTQPTWSRHQSNSGCSEL